METHRFLGSMLNLGGVLILLQISSFQLDQVHSRSNERRGSEAQRRYLWPIVLPWYHKRVRPNC